MNSRIRLLLLCVVCLGAPVDSHAKIGIYNWYPTDEGRYVRISYRLNTPALSGQIHIRSQENGALIKTIALAGDALSRGPHSIIWTGENDFGATAATGSYYAEITVTAPFVTLDPVNGAKNRHDFAYFPGSSAKYYGIAVDTNPDNNNQLDPSASTYGLVYAANSLEGTIEVYYPDQWSDSLAPGQRVTPKAIINAQTSGNQLAPWGIGIGTDGQIFSTGRANGPQQGFWNYSPVSASWNFAYQQSASESTIHVGNDQNGTGFQLRSSDNRVEKVKVLANHSYQDALPGDFSRVADNVITDAASSIFSMATNTTGSLGSSPLWITTPGVNPSVRRYFWNGSIFAFDSTWSIPADPRAPGSSATGADLDPSGAANLAVSCQRSTNNLLMINPASGVINASYQPVTGIIRSVRFDARGNIYFDSEGSSKSSRQSRLSVYFPPDSGSSDTRSTIPFSHTSGNLPPSVISASQSKSSIKQNNSDSVELLIDVSDNNGYQDISSVQVDLSALGYSSATMMNPDFILSSTSRRFRLSGIKAKPTSRAGTIDVAVTPRDSVGLGVPIHLKLKIMGGTITGTVIHTDARFPIANATVELTDSVSGNVYLAESSSALGTKGTYSIDVNPGIYTVSASKNYYGTPIPLAPITIKQDQVQPSVNPTLRGTSVSAVSSAPDGAEVCVQATVSAAAYRSSSITPLPGFSNEDGRSMSKFYIRDSWNSSSPAAGIAILNDSFKAFRGHLVVLEGVKLAQIGYEPAIGSITGYLDKGGASGSKLPEVTTLSQLTSNSAYSVTGDWGRFVKILNAQVVPGSRSESGAALYFKITDPSTQTIWTVRVWKTLGLSLASLPGDYAHLPVAGVVSRKIFLGENVIEPVSASSLVVPPYDVSGVGQAKALVDDTVVNFITPQIVTYLSPSSTGFFYIESPDRSAGIRVETSSALPAIGDSLLVNGMLSTNSSGERCIRQATHSKQGAATPVPLSMSNKEAAWSSSDALSGRLSPVGQFVRVWGRVSKVNASQSYFLLDDGSQIDSQDTVPGLKVSFSGSPPTLGSTVGVLGVISSEKINGQLISVVLARQQPSGITNIGQ